MSDPGQPGDFVARTATPSTISTLIEDLHRAGVKAGSTVLVHASLRAIGFVCGGASAVVKALLASAGPTGTIVVPTHSGDFSDPSRWRNPPVPPEWWPTIRAETPAFDPVTTPTWHMGAIADVLRSTPGAIRSAHPAVSFAAHGVHAHDLCDTHPLSLGLGDDSPLGRLYELDGMVLLLGVGFERNTSFHLAECRSGVRAKVIEGAPIFENDRRVWKTYEDLHYDDSDFARLGEEFSATGQVHAGKVGAAVALSFSQRACVDFAVQRLRTAV